jgi:hypothetical protein
MDITSWPSWSCHLVWKHHTFKKSMLYSEGEIAYVHKMIFSSSSTSCIGLSSVATPQIWLIHLFFGRPRLLFPVGLYDSVYCGERMRSIRVIWLNQLPLYLLMVSFRPFTFVFWIASLVSLFCLVTPNVDLKNLISAAWILFLSFSVKTQLK